MSYHSDFVLTGEQIIYKSHIKCRCGKERPIPDRALWTYKKRDGSEFYCCYTCWKKYDPDDGPLLIDHRPKKTVRKLDERDSDEYKKARAYIDELKPGTRFTREELFKHLYGVRFKFTVSDEKHVRDFLRKQPDIVPEAMVADNETCFRVVSYRKISETY